LGRDSVKINEKDGDVISVGTSKMATLTSATRDAATSVEVKRTPGTQSQKIYEYHMKANSHDKTSKSMISYSKPHNESRSHANQNPFKYFMEEKKGSHT
jgi:hypothetical protein